MEGIDCATPLNARTARALADAGVEFVCRSLVPARYAWKRLTGDEAEYITCAGMQIGSVFETTANRAAGAALVRRRGCGIVPNNCQPRTRPYILWWTMMPSH